MEFELTVQIGPHVLPLITDGIFVGQWNKLAEQDRKFTLLQEPAFVISWYRQHETLFEPIVCLGRDSGGQLAGLMALARSRDGRVIMHAGDFHAEYCGWIASPAIDQRFVEECLIAIKKTFGLKQWVWKWLPPGTPIGFLTSRRLAENGIFASFRTERSPVWNLEDTDRLNQLMKTKSIKNQINRFKKKGGFFLERVRDKERTRQLLKDLRLQCDFRQEAIQGVRPFSDNPCKEPFFVERQEFPEANHFTVLWSNERPVSFHFGACDGDTLVLGLTAYDPTESRNSPGKLHLIELARMLKEEGFHRIDLTPGGDQYKEFVANGSQELVIPTFHFSRTAKLQADLVETLRRTMKVALAAARVSPDDYRQAISRVRALPARLKRVTPGKLLDRIKRIFYEDVVYLQYTIECKCEPTGIVRDPEIFSQRYEDLLLYDGCDPWLDRRQLLSGALKRFGSGETLYSARRGEKLLHYGWVAPGGQDHFLQGVDVTFKSPSECAVLYDFFTYPEYRRQGLYQRNLRQILRDLADAGIRKAFIGVLEGNERSRRAIENVGFSPYRSFRRKRILWFERREERAY
jgi:CelD/BcsL family acetyltransferase involved in cellulose biosynthesis/GNAT superfamily N-acetyltransferase